MSANQSNQKGNTERPTSERDREKTARSSETTTAEEEFSLDATVNSTSWVAPLKTARPLTVINLADFKQTKEDETQSHVFGTSPNHSLDKTAGASESATAVSNDHQAAGITEICRTEQKPVTNQEQFDKIHGFRRVNLSIMRLIIYKITIIKTWRRPEYLNFLECRIPFISWIRSYNWKADILSDVIGGLMVSIMSIPQGLAYGFLVGLPPIHGLYTSIIGPLIYAFLGSSKHVSPGAFAIIALMVGAVVEQISASLAGGGGEALMAHMPSTNETKRLCCSEKHVEVDPAVAIAIASELTLLVGIVQIFLGILNAGVLAVWLSDHLVQGLTSGAAFHVLTSQLKTMTGVEGLPRTSDPLGIIKFYVCFINNIRTIKLAPTVTSIVCVVCLLFSKEIVDPVFKKWSKIKFPMELFVVVFSILLCWLSDGSQYALGLDTVGHVDSGMMPPFLPNLGEYAGNMLGAVFSISIVCFVIHIALAKLISKKLNYQIDANQEWLALGTMNFGSAFFGCFAGGASLSRTMTQVKLETKSQLSTIVCVGVLVGVVYGAAHFFYFLPKPVLACIVVVALKDLFKQIGQAKALFEQSIVDFLIWEVTFVSVILVNVNYGLAIGVVFALLTVVFRSQWAESTCVGRIPTTNDFKGLGHYRSAEEIPGIKIFRFDAPLYFANAELFVHRLHCATGLDPLIVVEKLKESAARAAKKKDEKKSSNREYEGKALLSDEDEKPEIQLTVRRRLVKKEPSDKDKEAEQAAQLDKNEPEPELVQLTHIIIDCSSFPYIDLMGIDALCQAHTEYTAINLTVFFCCCKVALRQLFETSEFYKRVPKTNVFVNIADAVTQAQYEQQSKWNQSANPWNVEDNTSTLKPQIADKVKCEFAKSLKVSKEKPDGAEAAKSAKTLDKTQRSDNTNTGKYGKIVSNKTGPTVSARISKGILKPSNISKSATVSKTISTTIGKLSTSQTPRSPPITPPKGK